MNTASLAQPHCTHSKAFSGTCLCQRFTFATFFFFRFPNQTECLYILDLHAQTLLHVASHGTYLLAARNIYCASALVVALERSTRHGSGRGNRIAGSSTLLTRPLLPKATSALSRSQLLPPSPLLTTSNFYPHLLHRGRTLIERTFNSEIKSTA
jgi:hypothetical protein